MRKVILYERISLDGLFQGPQDWDLDFFRLATSSEYVGFCVAMERQAGGLLLGRKTYEGFAHYWPTARGPEAPLMNGLTKYVFSRSLRATQWAHSEIVRGPPQLAVQRLKRKAGGDLFLFGSGRLATVLNQHDLIDEYWFNVVPVVLGKGRPVFGPPRRDVELSLVNSRAFPDGGVLVRYTVRPKRRRRRT
jgi:dihydrofolate reductase